MGPATLVMLTGYRVYTQIKVKRETGSFIDKKNSNWFNPDTQKFRLENVIPLCFCSMPAFVSTIEMSYAFSYAT